MLPSGNDAGYTLAEYFGALLRKDAEQEEKKRKEEDRIYDDALNKLEHKQEESGNEQTSSTNHTQNSRGSVEAPSTYDGKCEGSKSESNRENKILKDKDDLKDADTQELGNKDYFTGTQIKKSPFVVKHS